MCCIGCLIGHCGRSRSRRKDDPFGLLTLRRTSPPLSPAPAYGLSDTARPRHLDLPFSDHNDHVNSEQTMAQIVKCVNSGRRCG
jgi:hypothetical protein